MNSLFENMEGSHPLCNYLTTPGTVCNKCGAYVRTKLEAALRDVAITHPEQAEVIKKHIDGLEQAIDKKNKAMGELTANGIARRILYEGGLQHIAEKQDVASK